MAKETKSAEIMRLAAKGLSMREIAEKVGCRPEYARVVARQRKGSGTSEIDRRYREKNREQRLAYLRAYARRRRDEAAHA